MTIFLRPVARAKVEHAIIIVAEFDPPEGFYPDNGNEVEATVAVELALTGVREPQRLEFATMARVSPRKGKLAALHRHAMAGWVCLRAITMQLQAMEEPGRVVYSVASVRQEVIEKPSYMAKLAKLASKAKRAAGSTPDGGGSMPERHASGVGGDDIDDDDALVDDDLGVDESHHVLSGMGKVNPGPVSAVHRHTQSLLFHTDDVLLRTIREHTSLAEIDCSPAHTVLLFHQHCMYLCTMILKHTDACISRCAQVTREMTENAIEAWSNLLVKWDSVTDAKRRAMARKGVPDALRHQV